MKVGLIRALTLSDEKDINRHGRLIENAFPRLKVVSECIQEQPRGIYDQKSEREAKPKVMKLTKELVNKMKIGALIISCAADPAVRELKESFALPVIGAGESLASISSVLGKSVGVLIISEDVPSPVKKGLGEYFKEARKVPDVENTLDLGDEMVLEKSLEVATELISRGSDAIALACTGFSTIGLAKKLGKKIDVPVIDPIIASGSVVYSYALTKGDQAG